MIPGATYLVLSCPEDPSLEKRLLRFAEPTADGFLFTSMDGQQRFLMSPASRFKKRQQSPPCHCRILPFPHRKTKRCLS
jgi:hypothetical protein